jgi:hypothetical protein
LPTDRRDDTNIRAKARRDVAIQAWQRWVIAGSCVVSWDRPFDQPVPLPKGAPARTLRDAANYIKTLPKSEHDRREWRLAVHMLIEAAEDRGPMMFARMGILRATERDFKLRLVPARRQIEASHLGHRKLPRER